MLQQLRSVSRQFLGLNRRDRDLVARYNPRRLAHDTIHKLHTKTLLDACDIPVAETLAVYRFPHELRRFVQDAADWTDFVIKPAQGTGGGGVIVVAGREAEAFLSLGGGRLKPRSLETHLSDILNGVYSLNHRYDEAFVERRLQAHPTLARLSFQGLPDIRVIVFQGIPLMAMLRLATPSLRGPGQPGQRRTRGRHRSGQRADDRGHGATALDDRAPRYRAGVEWSPGARVGQVGAPCRALRGRHRHQVSGR